MNKVILFLTVLSYSVVVSQSFMYMLSLKNTLLALNGMAFTQVRQLIDANMNSVFRLVMYAAILFNFVYVVINIQAGVDIGLITSVISLVALVVDGFLTLKGNVPINEVIDGWSPADLPPNWKKVRMAWFNVFRWRQVVNVTGFLSLVVGIAF